MLSICSSIGRSSIILLKAAFEIGFDMFSSSFHFIDILYTKKEEM
jgi:hypothetical protein